MIISLIFGLTCLIALPIVAVINFLLLGTMRHIVAGNYLVHWTYTKAEWDRFTEDAWQRSSKLNAWVVGALALILFIWALASGSSALFLMLVIVVASVALLVFGSDYWLYTQRRKQGAGEVLIGRAGILRPEGFTPLSGLDSVTLEQGIIKFRCRYRAYQNRYYQTRYRTYEVPVPRGHEAEAEGLVSLLRRS
jgi:hypothetical protein